MLREYMTKGDVGRVAGVHPQTVHGWMERGQIRPAATTVGAGIKLFDPKQVEQYLKQRAKQAARK